MIAFVLTWIVTPIVSLVITIVLWPVLRELTSSNNDGTRTIMIPFFGIVTGLVAGIVAALIVRRRCGKPVATLVLVEQNSAVVTKAEQDAAPDAAGK